MAETGKWSIQNFYSKAWKLTWQHKQLWILGFAAAMLMAGSAGQFRLPSSSSRPRPTPIAEVSLQNSPSTSSISETQVEKPSDILPTSTVMPVVSESVAKSVGSVFTKVPISTYVVLGVEVVVMGLGCIALSLLAQAWASGAIIRGVAEAATKSHLDIGAVSAYTWGRVRSLLWLMIVPTLGFCVALVVAIMVGALVAGLLAATLPFVVVLLGLLALAAFVYFSLRFTAALLWGERYILLDGVGGKDGFKQGWQTGKNNLWKMIRLGVANVLLELVLTFVPLLSFLLPVILVIIGIATKNNVVMGIAFTLTAIWFLAFITFTTFVKAIWQVFVTATWHFAFEVVRREKRT